ncbi:hypothetical protein ACIQV2_24175 [Streptomyces globosus]|uniref:hypothetical protein n=1 Tax=Streptomyces globosus TaxID=68209 RepID=UPI0038284575
MVFPPERWTPCPATDWTCAVPAPARDCDWILVVELLLKETVGAEHAAAAFAAPARPPAPRRSVPRLLRTGVGLLLLDDPGDGERTALAEAARMPDHLVGRLLRALVARVHPDGPGAGTHPQVRVVRAVVAALPADSSAE